MKYRDPSTGQFKDLHFKVSDTLPIGAEVYYEGATTPSGWERVDDSKIKKIEQTVAVPAKLADLFPVGKVEIFFDNEDHSNYLGFTWERIAQGRTLIGIDSTDADFDTIGEFGGRKSNTYNLRHKHTQGVTGSTALNINQIPSHSHIQRLDYDASYNWQVTSVTGGSATGACIAEGSEVRSGKKPIETVTTGGGQGHTHTNPDTANALGNTTISTIQPYLVVAYWRRIS